MAALRAVFFGSPAFAVPSLRAVAADTTLVAVVSQPDRPAGRGQEPSPPPVKVAAAALGVPIIQPEKVRTPETEAALAAFAADIFVVVAYGRILPQRLLDLAAARPLQRPRVAVAQAARRRADPVVADPGRERDRRLDHADGGGAGHGAGGGGARAAHRGRRHGGDLVREAGRAGRRTAERDPAAIAAGRVTLAPQDDARATLAPLLTKADGHLTFDRPARVVSAHARGVDPWPGASGMLEGAPLKLFAPRVVDGSAEGRPGEVLGLRPEGLEIACAGGSIAFAELQMPGRRRLPAAAVLAGHRIPAGTVLA